MKPGKQNNVVNFNREAVIIPRSGHSVSRDDISENALKVLYRLKNAGYKSYLVGGGVRDLLLKTRPKDFDVVTDARPEQIRELFRNCKLIGRRFRLAHIRFGNETIEVSTFRTSHHVSDKDYRSEQGRIIRDNVYGDIDEDVWRRDFTVNALFYNIQDFSLVDYTGGLEDIEKRQLRLIGNPSERYREDPVRMLRAVRFAVKLGFTLHPLTEQNIHVHENLLESIPPARLYEEFLKLFMGGYALSTYQELQRFGLLKYLFPQALSSPGNGADIDNEKFIQQVMINTDTRINENRIVNPAFIVAALLWRPLIDLVQDHLANGLSENDAYQLSIDTILSRQVGSIAIPRQITYTVREIWLLQPRLKHTRGNRPHRLVSHPKFRAAYDFLVFRAVAEQSVQELADWWTGFLENNRHLAENNQRPGVQTRHKARRRRRTR